MEEFPQNNNKEEAPEVRAQERLVVDEKVRLQSEKIESSLVLWSFSQRLPKMLRGIALGAMLSVASFSEESGRIPRKIQEVTVETTATLEASESVADIVRSEFGFSIEELEQKGFKIEVPIISKSGEYLVHLKQAHYNKSISSKHANDVILPVQKKIESLLRDLKQKDTFVGPLYCEGIAKEHPEFIELLDALNFPIAEGVFKTLLGIAEDVEEREDGRSQFDILAYALRFRALEYLKANGPIEGSKGEWIEELLREPVISEDEMNIVYGAGYKLAAEGVIDIFGAENEDVNSRGCDALARYQQLSESVFDQKNIVIPEGLNLEELQKFLVEYKHQNLRLVEELDQAYEEYEKSVMTDREAVVMDILGNIPDGGSAPAQWKGNKFLIYGALHDFSDDVEKFGNKNKLEVGLITFEPTEAVKFLTY
ncbi:MAG: hypothetical protein Q8P93_04370 [bacterium]|nr:hypothetical protein [bacterium]